MAQDGLVLRRILPALTLVVVALGAATPAAAAGRGMPAPDGKPMLWPTTKTVSQKASDGRPASGTRYGFVNASGDLVAPARYTSYSYCGDPEGRPALVLAGDSEGSDLLDLTGRRVLHVEAGYAECAGTGYLIVADRSGDGWAEGAVAVVTGDQVLAAEPDQQVAAVNGSLVNVSQPAGEYFLDLATGSTTHHVGWVTVAEQEAGAPGVPAAARRSSAGKPTGRLGYVGRSGDWLLGPQFDAASAFRGGYAVVERDGRATFLDAGLRRVGGEWDRIRPITEPAAIGEHVLGYWVEADGRRGLLGPDLEPVVQPGPGQIDCEPGAAGACAVVAPDGTADLVQLPKGGVTTTLPAGFTRVLTAGLIADHPAAGQTETRIQSLASGRTITQPRGVACRGTGPSFVTCPDAVIDEDGDSTAFTSVTVVPGPSGGAPYYWATTTREQGFLDPDGRWRYRELR